ncbi:DHHC palmitoyltransferase-domain-containing protein [Pilobolus umbonatus]|nr:DHHC palmitoyltransferase-domain-containing protein [Pilobolus umbonatus]
MTVIDTIPEKIIVMSVVVFITYLQTTVNFYIVGPALGGWLTLLAQKSLAPMNITLISLYINYYLACITSPGHTPLNWQPPSTVLRPDTSLSTRIGFDKPRYCNICQAYKPPRAHHCKQCGKCILKMDHHCPWIGNCVGFGNYPYFIRFVFSVTLCCSYGLYLLIWRFQSMLNDKRRPWITDKPSNLELVVVVINIILVAFVILIVGILAVYHAYCLIKGQTTIEGSEKRKTRRMVRRRKIDPVEFPFDVGFLHNICAVLGYNIISWLIPLPSPGNGIDFAVKSDTDPLVIYNWPPYDPKNTTDSLIDDDDYDEHNEHDEQWIGRSLVRRDSEGYLVKEITMDDRMNMLNQMDTEEGNHDWRFDDADENEYYYDSADEEDEENELDTNYEDYGEYEVTPEHNDPVQSLIIHDKPTEDEHQMT